MSTDFLAALKQKSAQQQNGRAQQAPIQVTQPVQAPQPTPQPVDPIVVNCERILNRNRLDVYFSRKPGDELLNKLKTQGFRWNPTLKCWYHIDSEDNRVFCVCELGASFDDTTDTSTQAPIVAPEQPSDPSNPFEVYKRQITELTEHLKIDGADLQLLAIAQLHKNTFGRDA